MLAPGAHGGNQGHQLVACCAVLVVAICWAAEWIFSRRANENAIAFRLELPKDGVEGELPRWSIHPRLAKLLAEPHA
jgi:hypothetical protein